MHSLEQKIGYCFQDSLLLTEALTHPSLKHEAETTKVDNQRLEFLGDAVLQLIFTEELFNRCATVNEGHLTKLRIRFVSKKALTSFAQTLELGSYLKMGKGEIASGGCHRSSNLADGFEALVGAIYLDGGIDKASRFILNHCKDEIQAILAQPEEDNPKGILQEVLQGHDPESPSYHIVEIQGPAHRKEFTSKVIWKKDTLGQGSGLSKKASEIEAAKNALTHSKVTTIIHSTAKKE